MWAIGYVGKSVNLFSIDGGGCGAKRPVCYFPPMMRRRFATLAWLVLLVAAVAPWASLAADPPPDERAAGRRAYGLSSELMSPFCPGRTLQDCPSPNAGAVREQIRAWVDAGMGDEEILSRVEASFGDQVVPVPRTAWAWAAPLGIMIVGLGLLVLVLRRSVRGAPPPAA